MSQLEHEPLTNPNRPESNGAAGTVVAGAIHGDVLTGEHARNIVAQVYIEHQSVAISEEQIAEIVANRKSVQRTPGIALRERRFLSALLPDLPADLRLQVQTNRKRELELLLDHLVRQRIATVVGIGGIGKTTLVRTLLEMRTNETSSPLWLDFHPYSDVSLDDLLPVFAEHLEYPELLGYQASGRMPDRGDVLRLLTRLQQTELLWIVFDNLDSVLDDQAHFIDSAVEDLFILLASRHLPIRLLVTSRFLPQLPDRAVLNGLLDKPTIELGGLDDEAASILFSSHAPTQTQRDHLTTLIRQVGGHPLALRYLAIEAETWGLATLAQDTDLLREGIAAFAGRIFTRLTTAEKQALTCLFVYRLPQPIQVLVRLAGGGVDTRRAIRRLINKGLLTAQTVADVPRYRLHPLAQELITAELNDSTKSASHAIACDFYLGLERAPIAAWHGSEDIASLLEAHHHAVEGHKVGLAASILLDYRLPEYLRRWGEEARLIRLSRQTLGSVHEDYDTFLVGAGYAKLFDQDQPVTLRAELYGQLGMVARRCDNYPEALRLLTIGIDLLAEHPDDLTLIVLHKEAAMVLINLGDHQPALQHCQAAITQFERVPTDVRLVDRASLLNNAALTFIRLGRPNEALPKAWTAYQTYLDAGLPGLAHEVWDNIGVALYEQGLFEESLLYHRSALEFFSKTDNVLAQAGASVNLGASLHALQRLDEAQHYYDQALHWFQTVGDRRGILATRINLAELLLDKGVPSMALPLIQAALVDSESLSEQAYRPYVHYLLGRSYSALDAPLTSRFHLQEAIRYAQINQNQSIVEMAQSLLATWKGRSMI